MKLLRWTLAGASAYAIYKYTIGKRSRGEEVFVSPQEEDGGLSPERSSAAPAAKGRGRWLAPRRS
jgi:hypothetical protein